MSSRCASASKSARLTVQGGVSPNASCSSAVSRMVGPLSLRPSCSSLAPCSPPSIGIGGHLAMPPLPHHRAYGSVPRRFGGLSFHPLPMESRWLPGFRVRTTPQRLTPACPNPGRRFTPPGRASADPCRLFGVTDVARHPCYSSSPSAPCGDRSGLQPPRRPIMPSADFCAAVREPCGPLSPSGFPGDTMQISRGKPRSLPRTPAGFTVQALDGYGLRDFLPARPTRAASYPVAVRQVAISFHASFRRSLAVSALALHSCFTSIRLHRGLSPPDCWTCPAHRAHGAAFGGGRWPPLTCAARAGGRGPGRDGRTGARSNRRTSRTSSRRDWRCLAQSGVADDDQLAHDRDHGDDRLLAGGDQPLAE